MKLLPKGTCILSHGFLNLLFLIKISVESRFMKTSSPMFGMCVSEGQYILV